MLDVKFLRVRDVAAQLRIKADGVLVLIHAGQLAASNVAMPGSRRPRWRISAEALADFLAARQSQGPTPRARRRKRRAENVTQYF